MKNKGAILGFILIFAFLTILLVKEPFIGIADNSDYIRVTKPLGFQPQTDNRYFFADNFFTIKDMDSSDIAGSLCNILDPDVENTAGYFSTQFIIVKISMVVNFLIKVIMGKSPDIFNIKILGILYALIYSYGLYLLLKNINFKSAIARLIFAALSVFVLCDIGYILYFNSFYGEALGISSIMLASGSCVAFIKGGKAGKADKAGKSIFYGIVFFISVVLMAGAKVSNTPIGILAGLFFISLLIIKKGRIATILIIAGSLAITVFSVLYFTSTPDWMNNVTNYQTVFYGILKDSPSPEKDLMELGIPEKYLPLANSNGYLENSGFDINSEEFAKEVYAKASFARVLKFYMANPGRLIRKLVISAENSVIIRPSYLGNYSEKDMPERLSFTNRFSGWSNLRKNTLGYAFYIIMIYSILYFTVNLTGIISSVRKKDGVKTVYGLAGMLLLLTAMSQFVLPVIGNGEADLQKHMLLFNICFDLMILAGAAWIAENYKSKLIAGMIPVAISAFVIALLITPHRAASQTGMEFDKGDWVQFGSYMSKPLKWRVLDYSDENGYLLWCGEAIEYREFDLSDEALNDKVSEDANYGSNNWETSDIRYWLNNDFKNSFSREEMSLINKVRLKNVLSSNNKEIRTGGDKPYYWTAITPYADQNYNTDAYYNYSEDKVFLLDTFQLANYAYNNGIDYKKRIDTGTSRQKVRYWLRTPYYNSVSMVRMVDKDGFVYHKDANVKAGIAPAIYISDKLSIQEGSGTEASPYLIEKVK